MDEAMGRREGGGGGVRGCNDVKSGEYGCAKG